MSEAPEEKALSGTVIFSDGTRVAVELTVQIVTEVHRGDFHMVSGHIIQSDPDNRPPHQLKGKMINLTIGQIYTSPKNATFEINESGP